MWIGRFGRDLEITLLVVPAERLVSRCAEMGRAASLGIRRCHRVDPSEWQCSTALALGVGPCLAVGIRRGPGPLEVNLDLVGPVTDCLNRLVDLLWCCVERLRPVAQFVVLTDVDAVAVGAVAVGVGVGFSATSNMTSSSAALRKPSFNLP